MTEQKTKKFHESYLHRYAKEVFASWIREKISGPAGSYFIFDWKEGCQVKLEYPIWSREITDSTTKEIFGINPIWNDAPDYNTLISRGFRLEAVIDIAICDGSRLKYAVEVVHTHKTPCNKLHFLGTHGIPVYEISATWIMNQIKRPSNPDLRKC